MGGIDDALRVLRGHVLSTPVRLALMLLLVNRRRIEFSSAARVLGVKPGTLWHHVERLEREGLLRIRKGFTLHGPRTFLEATEEGVRETVRYVQLLHSLISAGGGMQDSSSEGRGSR